MTPMRFPFNSTSLILSLFVLSLCVLPGAVFAGEAVEVAAATGDDGTQVEVHEIVRVCDEGDDECDEERVHKIVLAGDGEHPFVIHHGDGTHGMLAGMHHGLDRTFLGVQLTELTPELRRHFGVPEDAGVMVAKVVEDSPAFRAGLQAGDIITAVGSAAISSSRGLSTDIAHREEGETVDLEIWRDGRVERVSATLEKRETPGISAHRMLLGGCEEGDCGTHLVDLVDCDGDEPCRVEIRCEDGECDCTVEGEPMDCDQIDHQRDED